MSAAERLEKYGVFDDAVIEAVDAAGWQNDCDFRTLADWYGVGGGPQRHQESAVRSIEYFHIKPRGDYDTQYTRVLHAPMATPVDESMAMRAMRLFEADPSEQLIVVGNPGAIGRRAGALALGNIRQVWNGDLTATNRSTLSLLQRLEIGSVDHIGYSYGADKAANATVLSQDYDVDVKRQVLMEPTSTADRGLLGLMRDFQASGAELDAYVARNQSRPLQEARALADTGFVRWMAGMFRLSNVAIAKALSTYSFGGRLEKSLGAAPNLSTTVFWGTESEISVPDALSTLVQELQAVYLTADLKGIAVPGMHHPGGDDIDLHAAMVLKGLGRERPQPRRATA